MSKPYSIDLRERVVAAVEKDGMSRRPAAAHFGVSYSAAARALNRHVEYQKGYAEGMKVRRIANALGTRKVSHET